MALLDKLKSLLGLDSGSDEPSRRDVGVTVERETVSTETEAAVKGVDTGSSTVEENAKPGAEASNDGVKTEAAGRSVEDDTGDARSTDAESPETTDAESPETADAGSETDVGEHGTQGEPEDVEVIKGIGPSYADRLSDADVESVADLAESDPDELAERTNLSSKRISRWVDRAKHRTR